MATKKQKEAPQEMDPSTREVKNPVMSTNQQRSCYAMTALLTELLDLFPETPYEVGGYDGRNVALEVTFDLSSVEGSESLIELLEDVETSDARVESLLVEDQQANLRFKSNPRTQDSLEPFGLADAWLILSDEVCS